WSFHLSKAGLGQVLVVVGMVAAVVAGLVVALPAKQVAGGAPPTFSALAPQGNALSSEANLPLDVPFQVQFTKAMNEASVERALSITPSINVKLLWDATGQVVSIKPDPYWQPYAHYMLDISYAATDQEGLGLANEIHTSFDAGSPTAGQIVATQMSDGLASPGTTFQLTFTRPVKLATVLARFGISPQVPVTITGDDPTDAASQVFTMTPKSSLEPKKVYVVTMDTGEGSTAATDSAGAALQPVPPLQVTTMTAPYVIRSRPQDGATSYDTNQPISVRFSVVMDTKSTAAAFSVTAGGKAVAGSVSWAESNTVIVLTPRNSFKVGTVVTIRVSTAARAAVGLHLASALSATFKISNPQARSIAWTAGSQPNSPWYASEVYYLRLMNCTRTGGWVTSAGTCSTVTHHTLPAQGALSLNAAISNKVARPYAKYMADHRLLDHFLNGTNPHSRLCNWGSFCGGAWGENIASTGAGASTTTTSWLRSYTRPASASGTPIASEWPSISTGDAGSRPIRSRDA
ncbi:MAG: Ig-like domain-containing protein, partial [Candidatus Limnocylindrales bacterium]